jgi:hypothetical protein
MKELGLVEMEREKENEEKLRGKTVRSDWLPLAIISSVSQLVVK